MANVTEEKNLKIYLILIHLNSHMYLVAAILDSADLENSLWNE